MAFITLWGTYVRPENRSHKNAIELLGLVTSKHLKKVGVEPLLEAFMKDLAQLEQVRVFVMKF